MLVAIGLLAGLLIVEVLLRVAFDAYACDERLGWTFAPGKTAWKYSSAGEFLHPVRFNEHGLHDRERSLEKPPGTYRILLLGDSMTAATHVPEGRGFPALLEQRLSEAAEPGRRVEVVNAGVDGYGQAQELLMYRELARRFEPDLVLAGIFLGNDLADNSPYSGATNHYLSMRCGRPYLELRGNELAALNGGRAVRPWTGVVDRVLRHSELYAHRYPAAAPLDMPVRFHQAEIFAPQRKEAVLEAWALTQRLLTALHDEVEQRGIPVVFVSNPEKRAVGQKERFDAEKQTVFDYVGAHAMLNEFLETRGYPYIDLVAPLRRHVEEGNGLPYHLVNSHWNEVGNAVAAEALYEWLADHCAPYHLPLRSCAEVPPASADGRRG
jgi:hypothetical protein